MRQKYLREMTAKEVQEQFLLPVGRELVRKLPVDSYYFLILFDSSGNCHYLDCKHPDSAEVLRQVATEIQSKGTSLEVSEKTQKIVNTALPVSDTWAAEHRYACRQCGGPARLHPETNHIWGCLNCGYTTASVSVYFVEVGIRQ